MLQLYADVILYFLRSIPAAVGEFAPLILGGALLFISAWIIRRILRGRL